MNEGIHLDLDTWIVPGQIRKANLCRGLGNRYKVEIIITNNNKAENNYYNTAIRLLPYTEQTPTTASRPVPLSARLPAPGPSITWLLGTLAAISGLPRALWIPGADPHPPPGVGPASCGRPLASPRTWIWIWTWTWTWMEACKET